MFHKYLIHYFKTMGLDCSKVDCTYSIIDTNLFLRLQGLEVEEQWVQLSEMIQEILITDYNGTNLYKWVFHLYDHHS
jgi:hypothetical protein